MNGWNYFIAVIVATVISAGGIGAVVTACVSFLSDRIASRLEMKYQLKLDKELETLKSQLENTNYISKAMFDVELSAHGELSEFFYLSAVKLSLLLSDELFQFDDTGEKIEAEGNAFSEAGDALIAAEKALYRNASFMPEDIFDEYEVIYSIMNNIYCECSARLPDVLAGKTMQRTTPEMEAALNGLDQKLKANRETVRKYLRTLQVLDS